MSLLPSEPLRIHPEVEAALAEDRPVVALESSVICQGLPPPHNLDNARRCEAAIREQGGVPATIALLDGQLKVGVTAEELERLATAKGLLKLGARDLGYGVATHQSGGTTVSATLALAAEAGVRVFATGGIGGVHRNAEYDVSADLGALARYPVAVVCAGAKSILDLPRTLETLETLSVPVVGLRTRELPAFYCRSSGLALEQAVTSERELALLCEAHWESGQASAVLAVQPCPEEAALPADEVERAIAAALEAAARDGIRGKAVTPYLLAAVSKATAGRSLQANLALLENNARTAARLAAILAQA